MEQQIVRDENNIDTSEIKTKQIKRNKIENVPIFKVGSWKGYNYKIQDLDEIVRNTNALIKAGIHEPPVKLGHREDQKKLLEESGLPSFGFVDKIYRIGDQLFADLIDVPDEVMEWVSRRLYDKVSAEIYMDYEHPETKEKIGKVLRAVAFLGADIPAVKGIGSIFFHNENKKFKSIEFEDKFLEEVNTMRVWTIDEIRRVLPCCAEKIQKYMDEKKKDKLDGEELAILLATMRFEEIKEKLNKVNVDIECPDGYIWDENLGKCIRLDGKEEERVVCPKGYKWDEEQKKCVKINQEESQSKEDLIKELIDIVLRIYGISIDEITPEIIEIIKIDLERIKEDLNMMKELEKFQLPGGTPTGWTKESFMKAYESLGGNFNSCVENVKEKVSDPESFCAWLKYRATGKWPGSKEWREDSEENQDVKLLKEKIKEYEEKLFKEKLKEFINKNRNIILPKFDKYIDCFSENLGDKIVKFDDKEVDLRKLFIDFLKDIVESKIVIFGEIAKNKEVENEYEIKDEERQRYIEKYSEIKPNIKVENVDLAILAEKISEKENISYRDALLKAYKILKQEEVK